MIENTESEKGIMVEVTGKMKGDEFVVASIKEYKKEYKEEKMEEKANMKKKMSK